jgi:hypothetical protein
MVGWAWKLLLSNITVPLSQVDSAASTSRGLHST